jgi:hypothetical protein
MVKIQIILDADVDDGDLTAKSPLMKILRVMSKEEDSQVKWYMENRERILEKEKEKRRVYAKEQYRKRKLNKETVESQINEVVLPVMPKDNVLRFDNL